MHNTAQTITYLAILGYRNPLLFTKAATTLDLVSDGRALAGVGVGFLKGEFEALGRNFGDRNRLFEETLTVYRLACSGEPIDYEGINFAVRDAVMLPRPIQHPHPPIWIG